MTNDDLYTWKIMAKNPAYWEVEDKSRIAAIIVDEASEAMRLREVVAALTAERDTLREEVLQKRAQWKLLNEQAQAGA